MIENKSNKWEVAICVTSPAFYALIITAGVVWLYRTMKDIYND